MLASANIEGYSKPGKIYLYLSTPEEYFFQLCNANLTNEPENDVINYRVARGPAIEFRKLYFRAQQRVLTMRPDEKCQEVTSLGNGPVISHSMVFAKSFSPPLKLEISKGWMDDPRRRIYFTSINYSPYSRFCVILTGKGSHRKDFDALMNKIK